MSIIEALQKHGLHIKLPMTGDVHHKKKCYGCIFNGEYRDMGACTPICDREPDLLKAFSAPGSKYPCVYRITRREIIALQNAILQVEHEAKEGETEHG